MIKAVLLDMDGVLVDSEPYHTKAIIEVLKEEVCIDVSPEEINEHIGLTYPDKLERIFGKRNVDRDIHELTRKMHDRYMRLIRDEIKLSSGVERLLGELSKHRMKIGLVTSSNMSQVEMLTSVTKTKKYFDVIVSGNDVKKRKPDPECYTLAAKKLNLKPDECIVIEDSVPGVIAAKEAGMKCIALPNPYIKDGDFSRADMIINSLKEVDLETVKKI